MNNFCLDNDVIDIVGICDSSKIILDATNNFWTQIIVDENLILPPQKPDIEQINSVSVSVSIIRKKVIVTPKSTGENLEGKKLTGRKLIIEGELCQSVTYTANVPEQSVHTAHFAVPFSAYIVIPETITINTKTADSLNVNFDVIPCVEDVFIKQICDRQIFKNVTLFLQAIPSQFGKCMDEC